MHMNRDIPSAIIWSHVQMRYAAERKKNVILYGKDPYDCLQKISSNTLFLDRKLSEPMNILLIQVLKEETIFDPRWQ